MLAFQLSCLFVIFNPIEISIHACEVLSFATNNKTV